MPVITSTGKLHHISNSSCTNSSGLVYKTHKSLCHTTRMVDPKAHCYNAWFESVVFQMLFETYVIYKKMTKNSIILF